MISAVVVSVEPRRESETTEYDCSTDDESLRFLMSETDQVHNDYDDDDCDQNHGDDDDENVENGDDNDDEQAAVSSHSQLVATTFAGKIKLKL